MNFNSIKNIILDLGGVIIDINPALTYQAFQQLTGTSISSTNQSLDHYPLFGQYERGSISTEEFIHKIRTEFNLEGVDENKIIAAWHAILLDVPLERHEILLKLKSKFNLFLLSNTNELHRRRVDMQMGKKFKNHGLNSYFNKVYTSYEMHLQKPEPEIFQQVLLEQNLVPSETVFIDDTEKHLNTASKLGIHTILASETNDLPAIFKEVVE